ncbi:MAG: sulfoxide reductase heme-binding subunit YedZ [Rhodospirillales bacterium]|nr:sulfoxide reductase heme-binding subunit YedZ [Rhodospirillales bacterium]MCW8861395.1 sulfoxide reductase heme-binding subunit YedZ [Rhodospirillales bacterium]MCW8952561.1 sulfoxide reductase heme-binding subunit YedZ [Rhodospirillales bacterium]MCW8971192.1 sulfoxide reductase heme-binding subunit YedZ [Rhodospirillales bacterium]MCW9002742.1 sulfoxide reductase heme-binding subunit YedZ [Rhodospirillales bacterium]
MPSIAKRLLKPAVFTLCLAPALWMGALAFTGGLGANPIEALTRGMGDWALRFLLVGLALTPLKGITGWGWPVRVRRMIGLFAFFYAALHLSSYVVLDQFFDWSAIWKDIIKRPYITVGMATFIALIPLAATSTNAMVRRLGGRRWKMLHRLVYAAGIGGVFHFFMLVKADLREPMIYAVVLAALLGWRIVTIVRKNAATERAI